MRDAETAICTFFAQGVIEGIREPYVGPQTRNITA